MALTLDMAPGIHGKEPAHLRELRAGIVSLPHHLAQCHPA